MDIFESLTKQNKTKQNTFSQYKIESFNIHPYKPVG